MQKLFKIVIFDLLFSQVNSLLKLNECIHVISVRIALVCVYFETSWSKNFKKTALQTAKFSVNFPSVENSLLPWKTTDSNWFVKIKGRLQNLASNGLWLPTDVRKIFFSFAIQRRILLMDGEKIPQILGRGTEKSGKKFGGPENSLHFLQNYLCEFWSIFECLKFVTGHQKIHQVPGSFSKINSPNFRCIVWADF